MSAQRVFVVDRAAFFGGDWPQGFAALGDEAAPFLAAAAARGRFEPRPEAEQTPAWKQWIPYCFLRCLSAGGEPEGVFLVRRSTGQSEQRLHGLWSIGLGGHVEPEDAADGAVGAAFFARALWRELREELILPPLPAVEPRFLGVLNDDDSAVGAVHAGLVYGLDIPMPLTAARDRVRVGEISKMSGGFGSLVELADLWQDPRRFETWSRFLIQAGILGRIDGSADRGRSRDEPDPA